jgi:hypothetical protein
MDFSSKPNDMTRIYRDGNVSTANLKNHKISVCESHDGYIIPGISTSAGGIIRPLRPIN